MVTVNERRPIKILKLLKKIIGIRLGNFVSVSYATLLPRKSVFGSLLFCAQRQIGVRWRVNKIGRAHV